MNMYKVNGYPVNDNEFYQYKEHCIFLGRCLHKVPVRCKQIPKSGAWAGSKFSGWTKQLQKKAGDIWCRWTGENSWEELTVFWEG